MNNELTVVPADSSRPYTAKEIKANVQLIQEVMRAVMKDGTHYGVVPGCGNKKALLKPGAETLLMTFRIAPFPEVQDLSTEDEVRFRVRMIGRSIITGVEIGSAFGECSSGEEKYKWKAAACQKEYEATPEDRRRVKYTRQGEEIQQIRTNPSDVANTVLKMAIKRAMVALTLTATAASDIFVQDVEDMDELPNGDAAPTAKATIQPPKAKSDTAPAPTQQSAPPVEDFKMMASRYDGFCKGCPDAVAKGQSIAYSKTNGTYHEACFNRLFGAGKNA